MLKNLRSRLSINPQYIALLAILLLAAFLRFWDLESLPPGLQHDEAYNGLDALSLINREIFPIFHEGWELYSEEAHLNEPIFETYNPVFFEGNFGREPLYIYLTAISIVLLGATPTAVRFVAAFGGVLAVLAVFLAASVLVPSNKRRNGREDGNRGGIIEGFIPLFAAFLMATNYIALTHSRIGLRVMPFVVISTLTIYCFWRGVHKSESKQLQSNGTLLSSSGSPLGLIAPKWFVFAGLLMGLGFYSYAAARFLPLVFIVFMVYWLVRERQASGHQWANIVVMFGTSTIVALPLVLYLLGHPYYLIFRSRVIANRGAGTYPGQPWITWSLNLGRIVRGFIWQGDPNILRNLPGRAFLDPLQVLFFLAGVVNIIAWKFKREDVFLLLWLSVMLLPGNLSGDAPHFSRIIGVIPPLTIIMAKGLAWIGQLMLKQLDGTRFDYSRLLVLLVMILLIGSAILTVFDYFGRYPNERDLDSAFNYSDWTLGSYAANLPEKSTIYLVPTQEKMATIYFAMGGDKERLRSFYSPSESLLPYGQLGLPAYYVIRPQNEETLARIAKQLTNAQVLESFPNFFAVFRPRTGAVVQTAETEWPTWGGAISLVDWNAELQDQELAVTLMWQSNVKMARSYTAYVHLLAEDGTLVSQLDRLPDGYPTADWQPGEYVQDIFHLVLPEDLETGTYALQTGFYYLPTSERLGEPEVIGHIELQ